MIHQNGHTLIIKILLTVALSLSIGLMPPYIAEAKETSSTKRNVSFTLKFIGVDDKELLYNIRSSVALHQQILDKSFIPAVNEYDWQRLIETSEQEAIDAVKPYGYYNASIKTERVKPMGLIMQVSLGKRVIVDKIDVSISGMAENEKTVQSWLSSFPLRQGSNLVQPDYDSAKSTLNKTLKRLGYFDARFTKQEIVINTQRTQAEVALAVESGIRYRYGEFTVIWRNDKNNEFYSDHFLKRFLTLAPGKSFDSQALQKVQSDMSSSPYFSFAELRPLLDEAAYGVIPIRVTLEVPKRLAYGASLGFGTDTGPRVGLSFENRRVNQIGHRLNAEVNGSSEKQSAVANYSIPTNGSKRDGLTLFASYINEDSDVRDSIIWLAGFDFNRSLSEQTQLSYGLSFRDEQFVESAIQQESQILLPSLTWQTVDADDLTNPNRGYRLSANLRGSEDSLGADISFAQLNISAKSVFSIGRGRLLGRAQVAQTLIREGDRLPTSLSFFTGGDYSVRGYAFESIGVNDESGDLLGGENLVTASIEYEHSIKGLFALAAFVDAGDAYDDSMDLKFGVGVGARWRLPFGAIRLDVASAQDLDGKPVRLHFTFGTDL